MLAVPEHLASYISDQLALIPFAFLSLLILRSRFLNGKIFFAVLVNTILGFAAYVLAGRSFYALFIATLPLAFYFLYFEKNRELARRYIRLWILGTFLSLSLLKVRCFVFGCCWGRFSRLPWSVYYQQSKVMPFLFVPTHPVQLYESLLSLMAFLVFTVLLYKPKQSPMKAMTILFLLTLAFTRGFSAYFRGDFLPQFWHINNIIWFSFGLTVIALMMITYPVLLFAFSKKSKLVPAQFFLMAILVSFLFGCLPPKITKDNDYKSSQNLASGVMFYETKRSSDPMIPAPVQTRNLLFIFGDEIFSPKINPTIQDYYKNPNATLENLTWWQYYPLFRQIYKNIYRIPQDRLGHQNLIDSVLALEGLGDSYDIVIITHGYPNYLTSGSDYFFSKDEFKLLPSLRHLNMVYMQACYSQSLMQRWADVGARYVIGYNEAHENIYWFYYFLRWYRLDIQDVNGAFAKNNANYKWKIERSALMIEGLKKLGENPETYLKKIEAPLLLSRDS